MKILSLKPSISAIKNTLGISPNKNLFSRILRRQTTVTKPFEVTDKPIMANLKAYYRTAAEKLNDIYLEELKNKSTNNIIVEHNIDAYDNLPKVIQDALSPNDITVEGHIDQAKINKLYKAAKANGSISEYSPTPTFWGKTKRISELDQGTTNIIPDEISTRIIEQNDIIAEAGTEHITKLATETLPESFADEITETATKIGAETAKEEVIAHIVDATLG